MAGRYNFTIDQGETLRRSFVWEAGDPLNPVNLTGSTAHMTMRPHRQAAISLDTFLTLRATDGAVDLVVPATTTAGWDFSSAAFDLEIHGTDVRRLLQGVVTLSGEQTT